MDKCSVETLIKETLIYYCRNYVGEAVEFKLDGLICITVNSEPVDTVFKIHEIISSKGTYISKNHNHDSNRRKCKRKLNNRMFMDGDDNSNDFDKENHTNIFSNTNFDKKIKVELDDNYSNEDGHFDTEKYACGVCSDFRDVGKQFLVNHLLDDHDGENDCICFCMDSNCQIGFLNEDQYLKHFQDAHKGSSIDSMHGDKDLVVSLKPGEEPSSGINALPIFPISSKALSKHQTSIGNVPKSSISKPFSRASSSSAEQQDGVTMETDNNASPSSDSNDDVSQAKERHRCVSKSSDVSTCERVSVERDMHACPYCHLVFQWKSSRDSHVLAHSSEGKLLECSKCSLTFSRFDSLRRHAAKCNGRNDSTSVIVEYSGLPDDNSNLMDAALSTLFTNPEDLAQGIPGSRGLDWTSGFDQEGYVKGDPIEIASDQEGSILEEPNLTLELIPSFKRSGRRRHTKYITTLDPNRCFTCEVCLEFVPGGVEAFKLHCSHLHQRVPCPYCGCTYTQKASMERHQRQHTGERPYVCALCPRSYTRKENLHMHRMRFHSAAEDVISVP